MLKKIILLSTIVFLLFEVIYFDSNKKIKQLEDDNNGSNVYTIAIDDDRKQFLEDYENIILEISDDKITVLTDSNNFTKITKKYPIRIVK